MKFISLYRVELRRLALSKFVWVIAALSLCSPLFGYSVFTPLSVTTMNGKYLANPVLAGTLFGAVLWAVLTFLESDRVYRANADVLVNAAISPIRISAARELALLTLSTVTALLCALIYLPYTVIKINDLFDGGLYVLTFVIFMMPTIWISILLAAALYQITRRVELSGLLYAGMVYFSLSGFVKNDFFARWINPLFVDFAYSDGFTNAPTLRIAVYTRTLWLALSAGAWVFSLICARRYQKRLLGSFLIGLRKAYLPIISAMLIFAGVFLWVEQPFVNHAPYEFDLNHLGRVLESKARASATEASYDITADPSGCISGIITYKMNKTVNSAISASIWFDPGYTITNITCDGKKIDFKTLDNDINDRRQTTFSIPKGDDMDFVIEYRGMPKLLRCFSPASWHNGSAPGYFSLNNASSVPINSGFLVRSGKKLRLTLPERFTPIVDHKLLTDFTQNPDNTRTWETSFSGPTFWVTACDYGSKTFDAAGAEIDLYYSIKYEPVIEKYDIPQVIADVMEYCTSHLGGLSFVAGGKLMMVQRSGDGSGNAGNGWVEWGEPIFSEINLSDPLKGAGASEVFAHEIVHEWWGGLGVSLGYDGLWTDEGMTVYTTYRLFKEKYGEEYAKSNYVDAWQTAVDAQDRSYYYRHPEMLSKLPEKYQAELKAEAERIDKYCRMPLMILKAERLVGGEEKMDEILRDVQQKYLYNGFENLFTYQMFLNACGLKASDLSLE